jgi:hypothetical protein
VSIQFYSVVLYYCRIILFMVFVNVNVVRTSTVTTIVPSNFARSRHRSVDRVRRLLLSLRTAVLYAFCVFNHLPFLYRSGRRFAHYYYSVESFVKYTYLFNIFINLLSFIYFFKNNLLIDICGEWFTPTTHTSPEYHNIMTKWYQHEHTKN